MSASTSISIKTIVDPKLEGTQTTHGQEVCNTAGKSLLALAARYQRFPRTPSSEKPPVFPISSDLQEIYSLESGFKLSRETQRGLQKLAQFFGVRWTEEEKPHVIDMPDLTILRAFARKFNPHLFPERDYFYIGGERYTMELDEVFSLFMAALEDEDPFSDKSEGAEESKGDDETDVPLQARPLVNWNPETHGEKFKNYLQHVEGYGDLCTTAIRNDLVSFLSELHYPGIRVVYNPARFIIQELEKFLWEELATWEASLYAGLIYDWVTGEGELSISDQLKAKGFHGRFKLYIDEELEKIGLKKTSEDTELLDAWIKVQDQLEDLKYYLTERFSFASPPDKALGVPAGRLWQVGRLNKEYPSTEWKCVDLINRKLYRLKTSTVRGLEKLDAMAEACFEVLGEMATTEKMIKKTSQGESFPREAWERLQTQGNILKTGSDSEIQVLIAQIQSGQCQRDLALLTTYVREKSSGRDIFMREFFVLWEVLQRHHFPRYAMGINFSSYHFDQQIRLFQDLISEPSPLLLEGDAWFERNIRPSLVQPVPEAVVETADLAEGEIREVAPVQKFALLGLSELNTIFLHALRTDINHPSWTPLFIQKLNEAISLVEENFEGTFTEEKLFLAENIKRDSYPSHLIGLLKKLVREKISGKSSLGNGLVRWISGWMGDPRFGLVNYRARRVFLKQLLKTPSGEVFTREFLKGYKEVSRTDLHCWIMQVVRGREILAPVAVELVFRAYLNRVAFRVDDEAWSADIPRIIEAWIGEETHAAEGSFHFAKMLLDQSEIRALLRSKSSSIEDLFALIKILAKIPGSEVIVESLVEDPEVFNSKAWDFESFHELYLLFDKFKENEKWTPALWKRAAIRSTLRSDKIRFTCFYLQLLERDAVHLSGFKDFIKASQYMVIENSNYAHLPEAIAELAHLLEHLDEDDSVVRLLGEREFSVPPLKTGFQLRLFTAVLRHYPGGPELLKEMLSHSHLRETSSQSSCTWDFCVALKALSEMGLAQGLIADPAFKLSQLLMDDGHIDLERVKEIFKAFKATGDQALLNLFFVREDVAALIRNPSDLSTIIRKAHKLGWGSSLEVLMANPALKISITGLDPLLNLEVFLHNIRGISGHQALSVRAIEEFIPKIRTGMQLHRILQLLEEILVSNPTELALRVEALFENPALNLSQVPEISSFSPETIKLQDQAERIIRLKGLMRFNPATIDRIVKKLIMDSVNLIRSPYGLLVVVKILFDLRKGNYDWVNELLQKNPEILNRVIARSGSVDEAMKLLPLFARAGLFDQGFERLEYWYQENPGWELKQPEWIRAIGLVEDLQVQLLILDRALNNKDSLIYAIFRETTHWTHRLTSLFGSVEPGVHRLEVARAGVLKELKGKSLTSVGPFHRSSISRPGGAAGAGAGAGAETGAESET